MENICVDTDVLVDFLRNKEEAVMFIETKELTSYLATTYINLFELYYGAMKSSAPEQNVMAVDKLRDKFTILNLSVESVKEAGRILVQLEKRGEPIDFRDLLVGAIALRCGFKLKTRNKKHFTRINNLELI